MEKEEVFRWFPPSVGRILKAGRFEAEGLEEIRLRAGRGFSVRQGGEEFFLAKSGVLTKYPKLACEITPEEIRQTMEILGQYSLYAYEEELRRGFLSVRGGHRVGVGGKVIVRDGQPVGMQHISSINIRIARQRPGCADALLAHLMRDGWPCHTLLISPPRCGKTTLLRDLIRQFSDGFGNFAGCTVGVVDERSEIGAACQGVPQNDIGMRTDLLDCCPKPEGIMMLLRSMAPDVIAVDEIGSAADVGALEAGVRSGCRLFATVHGSHLEDIRGRPQVSRLLDGGVFERFVTLARKDGGFRAKVQDRDGAPLHPGWVTL